MLGHESLGRVLDPGPTGGLQEGDLVVGIVRRPDPVPCPNCAVGEWDMCRNGQDTERGIKQIDGFMSERWRIQPEDAMKVDRSLGLLGVLLEPTTVVTKAWEQVHAVGQRAFWEPRHVLVTRGAHPPAGGAGRPSARLGRARIGPRCVGLEARSRSRLGGDIPHGRATDVGFNPDVIVECTGVGQVIADCLHVASAGGVVCLTGVGSGGRTTGFTADVAAAMVLQNNVVVGSVNANRPHGTRRHRCWRVRIAPGSADSSRGARGPSPSCEPSSVSRTTSRWSSSSRRHERSEVLTFSAPACRFPTHPLKESMYIAEGIHVHKRPAMRL